jgi:hypothetical protein
MVFMHNQALFLSLVLFAVIRLPSLADESRVVEFTPDGAWCYFQDPRAVYVDGEHRRTFAQWMTRDGSLVVGSYDHDTREIVRQTLKANWHADDHNVGSFLVLPDNRLMAFYAQHNQKGIYTSTTVRPEDITEWGPEVPVSEAGRITYAHPCYLADEKLFYVFWRGGDWKPTYATSPDGVTWSEPRTLLSEPEDRENGSVRPYLKVVSDGRASIHLAFTDGHPRNEPTNSVYYLRYAAGEFRKANGEVVGTVNSLPIAPSHADVVYDGVTPNVRAWVTDIAVDAEQHPVIAYARFPAENDHRYYYARWTGGGWLDSEITKAGKWFPNTPTGRREPEPHYSGGMALNQSIPSVLYSSRPIDGVFEIERWTTPDGGKSWQSQQLTKNSTANNVRPVFPRSYRGESDHVLWMNGTYRQFTDYETGIEMLVP